MTSPAGRSTCAMTSSAAQLASRRRPRSFQACTSRRAGPSYPTAARARGEGEAPARALAAPLDRPRRRRAAARAERRPESAAPARQPGQSAAGGPAAADAARGGAGRRATRNATARRLTCHLSRLCASVPTSVGAVRVACGQARSRREAVVRFEQLLGVADVVPAARRTASRRPARASGASDEPARLVGRVARPRDSVRAAARARAGRDTSRSRRASTAAPPASRRSRAPGRPGRARRRRSACELAGADVVHRDRARAPLRARTRRTRPGEVEQVVACDHEQVVVETGVLDHERMSPIAPRRSSFVLVPSSWTVTSRPCAQRSNAARCASSSRRPPVELGSSGSRRRSSR